MKKTATTYVAQFMTATARAAKVKGVDVAGVRANYRNFKNAPAEYKGAILLAYKIMKNYKASAAKAAAPAEEPAEQ